MQSEIIMVCRNKKTATEVAVELYADTNKAVMLTNSALSISQTQIAYNPMDIRITHTTISKM